ncbi:hypothetical protein H5410_026231 [Solanum commersonii]|uniref:Uncharacterized protein n=1 Tax=Solanum commersonii TaxID=4109 RepID=A0A9J5YVH3_SOLCO|nr:hypothetical protein H5410_026231 [Solanum commersonii]
MDVAAMKAAQLLPMKEPPEENLRSANFVVPRCLSLRVHRVSFSAVDGVFSATSTAENGGSSVKAEKADAVTKQFLDPIAFNATRLLL